MPATCLNWERVARAAMHPVPVAILEMMDPPAERSPKDISEALTANGVNAPLGVVSYHVRMLRSRGLLELARTEPRRGAVQHFYRLAGGVWL